MELTSFLEWDVTREKLRKLEAFHAEQERTPARNPFVRELSQHSLMRVIQQLREEIARFEAKAKFPDQAEPSTSLEPSLFSPPES